MVVYKAFKKDGKVMFLCFSGNLGVYDKVHIMTGDSPLTESAIYVVPTEIEDIDIPKEYLIGGVNGNIRVAEGIETTDLLLKDMKPEYMIDPKPLWGESLTRDVGNWLMWEDKPLCSIGITFNSENWSLKDYILHYREETPVYVMRDYYTRHKKDKEYVDLTINLDTGLCLYSYKKYKDDRVTEYCSKFNKKYRFWECVKRTVSDDIISVKR